MRVLCSHCLDDILACQASYGEHRQTRHYGIESNSRSTQFIFHTRRPKYRSLNSWKQLNLDEHAIVLEELFFVRQQTEFAPGLPFNDLLD